MVCGSSKEGQILVFITSGVVSPVSSTCFLILLRSTRMHQTKTNAPQWAHKPLLAHLGPIQDEAGQTVTDTSRS